MKMKNIIKRFISAGVTFAMFSSMNAPVMAAKEKDITEIYVATNGSDNGTGSIDSPFATLDKARNYIRELKKNGSLGTDGAVVYLREGQYGRSESFLLTSEDSGTESAPITYRSYPGEKVIIHGGVNVDTSKFKPISDADAIARIDNQDAVKNIYQASFDELGIEQVPEMVLRGSFSYYWPDLFKYYNHEPQKPAPAPEMFMDGKPLEIARYPNTGNMKVAKILHTETMTRDVWGDTAKETPDFSKAPYFEIVPDDTSRIERWQTAEDAILWGKWGYLWADQSVPLKSVDKEQKSITSLWGSLYNMQVEREFYIYNLIEELDAPGEIYFDRNKEMVYMYPYGGKFAKDTELTLSLLTDSLIKTDETEYITFKDLIIGNTRGIAVEISGGEHNTIDGCEISYTGDKAVNIGVGKYSGKDAKAQYNGIKNSHVHDVEGGVFVNGGSTEYLIPAYNYIENCDVHDFARFTKTYLVGMQLYGCGNRISYSELHGGLHSSLGYTGQYQTIEYNEFYDLANDIDDMGALYNGRYFISRGNRVIYNYFHDLTSERGIVHGVYEDDGQSGDTVFGNVFENVTGYGVHLTGRESTVMNNVFINVGKSAVLMDFRQSDPNGAGISAGHAIANLLNSPFVKSEIWREHFPELEGAEEDVYEQFHRGNVISNNLLYNTPPVSTHSSLPQTWGVAENNWSTTADPGFYDVKNRNYLLKPDAKVFKEIPGFEPIPFTRMGRYGERAMERIKSGIALSISEPRAFVDGELKMIEEATGAMPFIEEGRTYVPLRFLCEALGGEVEYDDETKDITIKVDSTELNMNPDTNIAKVNGEEVELEVKPMIVNGRTYVPLRAVSELTGKQVFWDDRGFIAVSDTENLFDSTVDSQLIDYISGKITVY